MKMNIFGLTCILILLAMFNLFGCQTLTTDQKLANLRAEMKKSSFDAVIIPSEDEHQSEYVSEYDMRRAWITGFTGSAGIAVVTDKYALLWTDGRYYLQAEEQLDPNNWQLMKAAEPETLSIEDWLSKNLTQMNPIVAQNAKFTSISTWKAREAKLAKSNIKFASVTNDLIDAIWPPNERPNKPNSELEIHGINYSGLSWQEKINLVQKRIGAESVQLFVVTALDEVAWLYNLRGTDIPYNPMFFAYSIIDATDNNPILYVNQKRPGFENIKAHLSGIDVRDYEKILDDLKGFSDSGKSIWVSPSSSYAVFNAISNKANLINDRPSPIRSIKAVKNPVEINNIKECQLRDSAARIRHMHWLETEMKKGSLLTEMSAANMLEQIQEEDSKFKSLSFESISAVGANAAIVHYSTKEGINSKLSKDKIYLLDAGAQYSDCTTDVTRTHHFGTPSSKEKLTYTKVMQGSIDLANIVFPTGVYGREVDVEARAALWRSGLDYGHGTGHGIGYFLSVHENPPTTSYNSRSQFDEPYAIGMVTSDEPGYYEDGLFGIRLETDLHVVEAKTPYTFRNRVYLKFEPLTLVPFETNLIDHCLLTNAQVDWLNEYNALIKTKVEPKLKEHPEVQKYLASKIQPFKYAHTYAECNKANAAGEIIVHKILLFQIIGFLVSKYF